MLTGFVQMDPISVIDNCNWHSECGLMVVIILIEIAVDLY